MRLLQKIFSGSPVLPRVVPFFIFIILTAGQGKFGPTSAYWFYLVKTLFGAWLIFEMWPWVKEMRWAFSWEAVAVGVGVFAIWVGLDDYYPTTNELFQNYLFPFFKKIGLGWLCSDPMPAKLWNPTEQFGSGSIFACLIILARILGSTFIVPPLEEIFYRSFLYRYLANQNFLTMPLNKFLPWPFLLTVAVFGFSHNEWLAGILCGTAYQWLVIRKNRLGDAMTAHAITNFLLGVWVVWREAWHFW